MGVFCVSWEFGCGGGGGFICFLYGVVGRKVGNLGGGFGELVCCSW